MFFSLISTVPSRQVIAAMAQIGAENRINDGFSWSASGLTIALFKTELLWNVKYSVEATNKASAQQG